MIQFFFDILGQCSAVWLKIFWVFMFDTDDILPGTQNLQITCVFFYIIHADGFAQINKSNKSVKFHYEKMFIFCQSST